jgi:Asp-tRNA(Asn)/Glu-tRNA(Gln) amidotransferase A subunit family amidase
LLGNFILSEGYDSGYLTKAQKLRRQISEELILIKQNFGSLILPLSPFPPAATDKPPKPLHMYETDKFAIGANLAGMESLSRENIIVI